MARKGFNEGVNVKALVDEMDPGIARATLRVLSFHQGRDQAIGRDALVMAVEKLGFRVHERAVRAAINQLRKEGQPICSTGGEGGGYYFALDWEELDEYLGREVHSRAMDLLEQEQALRKEGERRWGAQSLQGRLF